MGGFIRGRCAIHKLNRITGNNRPSSASVITRISCSVGVFSISATGEPPIASQFNVFGDFVFFVPYCLSQLMVPFGQNVHQVQLLPFVQFLGCAEHGYGAIWVEHRISPS